MFKNKKKSTIIPAQYGTIERRTLISPEKDGQAAIYQTSVETIVLRQPHDMSLGDVEWETRSERILIEPAREVLLEDTGQKVLIPAKYKTITKQVAVKIHQRPPQNAIKLIYFFVPPEVRDVIVGDIQEHYNAQREVLGERGAKLWVWKESIFSFLNLFIDWVIKKISKLNIFKR